MSLEIKCNNVELINALHSRPTTITVDLAALRHNFSEIKKTVAPAKVMAMIKANAYGHGLIGCGLALESFGVDALAVAYVEEGIALRRAGIRSSILVLSGMLEGQIQNYIENDLAMIGPSVVKLEQINEVAGKLKKKARVHLKIDTGMERLGQHYYSAESLLEKSISCKWICIEGIMSHFASSDEDDLSFTKTQLERFLNVTSFFERRSLPMPTRHIANSAGLARLPECRLDMVRPGFCLYGLPSYDPKIDPSGLFSKLKPVMSLKSRIVYFKVIEKGVSVSYNQLWRSPCQTRLVTIPIGYGDGLPRNLTNKLTVLIRGKRYKSVGRICMDQLMVDLGPNGEGYNGDEVVIIGKQGDDEITVEDLARLDNTSPYEILVSFNERIPRVYVDKD